MKTDIVRIGQIDEAVKRAGEFIEAASRWRKALESDEYAINASREGGTCKRRSMDLTNALVPLRKSPFNR